MNQLVDVNETRNKLVICTPLHQNIYFKTPCTAYFSYFPPKCFETFSNLSAFICFFLVRRVLIRAFYTLAKRYTLIGTLIYKNVNQMHVVSFSVFQINYF